MKQRYGFIGNIPVYLMDKSTKIQGLDKKGYINIQNLKTGNTATVKKSMVKNISFKYPTTYKQTLRGVGKPLKKLKLFKL